MPNELSEFPPSRNYVRRALSVRSGRRGAATVETAMCLLVLLTLLFGLFDLGLAVFRHNMLSASARAVARTATLRSAGAAPEAVPWGPAPYDGNAGDGSEIAQAAAKYLAAMDPSGVAISVRWLDGDNQTDNRVSVHLQYRHAPAAPMLGFVTLDLQADAAMRIVN